MAKSGLYTGVDIGTNTIKVLVAEYVQGEMNIIGVGNAKSDGLKNGIIIDIEKVANALRKAVSAAEERAGVAIDAINVSIPADQLQIDPCQGMVPISGDAKEIVDNDILQVVQNALMRGLVPEREIISVEPKEFAVDNYTVTDPRGMIGMRLEMRGLVYTGPKTLIHTVRKVVERAGLLVENIVIAPLATAYHVLSEGEREFGTVMIDMGAGQTTVTVVKEQNLRLINQRPEGGDYVTKDISTVLNTSLAVAEDAKLNYGEASTENASADETFPIEVVGKTDSEYVSELYLSQIIEARMVQIFERIRQELEQARVLDLPGGVILLGGAAMMPGIVDLTTEVLGMNTRRYVPSEMGLRNPAFAQVISIVNYVGNRSDVEVLVARAVSGGLGYTAAVSEPIYQEPEYIAPAPVAEPIVEQSAYVPEEQYYQPRPAAQPEKEEPKEGITDRIGNMFRNLFD